MANCRCSQCVVSCLWALCLSTSRSASLGRCSRGCSAVQCSAGRGWRVDKTAVQQSATGNTTGSTQRATDNRQQTTDNRQQTTDNGHAGPPAQQRQRRALQGKLQFRFACRLHATRLAPGAGTALVCNASLRPWCTTKPVAPE
jgi:hypothetical protein